MTRRPPLAMLMLASFAVGVVLMVLFDATITRILGMAALITFMVSGVFLVASPDLLEPDDDDRASAATSRPRTTRTG